MVAHGYLADTVLRLRFELNTASALLVCAAGMIWQYLDPNVDYKPYWWTFPLVAIAFSLFFFWEIRQTAILLADTRQTILAGPVSTTGLQIHSLSQSTDDDKIYVLVENRSGEPCESPEVTLRVWDVNGYDFEEHFTPDSVSPHSRAVWVLKHFTMTIPDEQVECSMTIDWAYGTSKAMESITLECSFPFPKESSTRAFSVPDKPEQPPPDRPDGAH